MELAGDGAATDSVACFKDERLQSGLGEIKRRREAVMPAADDDDISHALVSARILVAALRPGAPMMPPPGWVAEPHMYRLSIGVLYCAHPGAGRRKKSCSSVSSPWKMLPSESPHS